MSKFAGLAFATEQASRLVLTHPVTGQPLRNAETGDEAWIDLLAEGSSVGRAHDRVVTDRLLKRGKRQVTAEEIDADAIEKLAKLTRGWSLVTLDGAPIDVGFDQNTARELYATPELSWLRDQVASFAGNIGNFKQAPSTN